MATIKMTKEEQKEFKRLERENKKIRGKIDKLLDYPEEEYKEKVWEQINLLIDNEAEQEGYCNQ